MKKVILLVLAGVALFAFIFGTSMLWYKFFYNSTGTSNTTGNINVQLSNSNNVIDESGLIPLDDETAKSLTPYEFTVVNNGENSTIYNVLLEDAIISDDVSYSSKELLSRNQLRYQLSLNGTVIKSGDLSDIKNNVLDTRNILSGHTNNYQLRIYVAESSGNTDWQNKYYHFNINVQMEEDL